jgi:hypothetical protein
MGALEAEAFLKALAEKREALWAEMNAENKSYGAERPLTPSLVLRRLQFGIVMERRAGEVTARWIPEIPDLDIQHALAEYVANELRHAAILRDRVRELEGDPDVLWASPPEPLVELWRFHESLDSFCELAASVQYGHEEFFPRTSQSFIRRVEPIDPKTAAIYRDTLLAEEESHEWLAPEALRRYARDEGTQKRCMDALERGCRLFARAIETFNRAVSPP